MIFSYVLTSRGAAAVRRRSTALIRRRCWTVTRNSSPSPMRRSIDGQVILEFLAHEVKRLQHFDNGFSVLLAKCVPATMDQSDNDSPAQWLTRLRRCLPDVDLIGQLADAL